MKVLHTVNQLTISYYEKVITVNLKKIRHTLHSVGCDSLTDCTYMHLYGVEQRLVGGVKSYDTCHLYIMRGTLWIFPWWSCGDHRIHRVATAAFWRTFHHEGKISPG
jgi:hypothetical protein